MHRSALFLLLLASLAVGQETPGNAALLWWQAFSLLEEPSEDLQQRVDAGAPEALRELVAASALSLEVMARAAARQHCDWGLEPDQGPRMLLPHLSQARELASLALVDARLQLEAGAPDAALTRASQCLRLARQVGGDPLLICLLVQYSIEGRVFDFLAQNFRRFPFEALEAVVEGSAFDDRAAAQESIAGEEQTMLDWLLAELEGGRPVDDLELGLEPAVIVAEAPELRRFYARVQTIFEAPYEQIPGMFTELEGAIEASDNQLVGAVFPTFERVAERAFRQSVQRSMLRAALALRQGGAEAADRVLDPCGRGPFERTPRGEETVWGSKLRVGGKPFEWTTR